MPATPTAISRPDIEARSSEGSDAKRCWVMESLSIKKKDPPH